MKGSFTKIVLRTWKNYFINGMHYSVRCFHICNDDVRDTVVCIRDFSTSCKTDGERTTLSRDHHLTFGEIASLHGSTCNHVVLKHSLERSNWNIVKAFQLKFAEQCHKSRIRRCKHCEGPTTCQQFNEIDSQIFTGQSLHQNAEIFIALGNFNDVWKRRHFFFILAARRESYN